MPVFPGFVGSAYAPQSPNVDCQRLVNWYLEASESPAAKVPTSLMPAPGFLTFATLPQSPVRGLFAQNDRTFAVGGDRLYEIDRLGVVTHRAMTTLSTPVAPTITNSPLTPALAAPAVPVITHGGTLGTTTYGYKVTAMNALGETTGSTEGTSVLGNATLSATNYNIVSWGAVAGSTKYRVYRTTGPGAGQLIAEVSSGVLFFNDIGATGTATVPPASNTTGGTAGSSTWGYKIVARLGLGATAGSGEGTTATGQSVLTTTNYNIVTWPAVTNASSYDVYRTKELGISISPKLIGSVTARTLNDTGIVGTAQAIPTSDTTGTATIVNDGTPVSICSSGDAGGQLFIVSGGQGFVFDLSNNTLAKVLQGATAGGYIGGYFVSLDAATSTMKVSELLEGFIWDGAQVYQRTAAGDRWLAMGVTHNEIWLLGSATTEVWVGTGDTATRFAPFSSVFVEEGVMATSSLARVAGSLMWLTQNAKGAGAIVRTENYTPVTVSTRGIEKALAGYSTLADAVGWSYQQQGHTFYVLTFPTDNATWVFDVTTGEWHERLMWDANQMRYEAYRPQCYAFAFGGIGFGVSLVGDRSTGVVAKMDPALGLEIDGTAIRRLRRSPHVSTELKRMSHYRMEVDLEVGLGLNTGQGSDPTVMLRYSNDGSKTWSSELWRSAGAQGKYQTRVRWNRLGSARDRVFEVVVSDPVPWRLAAAYLSVQEGAS